LDLKRLLVISLDPDVRRFVRITLERAGFAVAEARGRSEALAALAGVELLVWDLSLEEDGAAVLAEARLPVIFLAAGLPQERASGRWILHKPFDPGELVGMAEAVLHPTAA
jgi:DNA-binding response OmpR family regulator